MAALPSDSEEENFIEGGCLDQNERAHYIVYHKDSSRWKRVKEALLAMRGVTDTERLMKLVSRLKVVTGEKKYRIPKAAITTIAPVNPGNVSKQPDSVTRQKEKRVYRAHDRRERQNSRGRYGQTRSTGRPSYRRAIPRRQQYQFLPVRPSHKGHWTRDPFNDRYHGRVGEWPDHWDTNNRDYYRHTGDVSDMAWAEHMQLWNAQKQSDRPSCWVNDEESWTTYVAPQEQRVQLSPCVPMSVQSELPVQPHAVKILEELKSLFS